MSFPPSPLSPCCKELGVAFGAQVACCHVSVREPEFEFWLGQLVAADTLLGRW